MTPLLNIVSETPDILVVNKPSDLVCHPTKGDELSSLVSRGRLYLERSGLPGSIHIVNRLDRETSGLVVLAKNPETAAELGHVWEGREVRKTYWGIVHGLLVEDEGVIDAPLGRDETSEVAIKNRVRPDGASARTAYRVLQKFSREGRDFSLLELEPLTGRKHQIRIHLQHIGHPLVGEKLYAGHEDDYLALVQGRLTEEARGRLIFACQALHAGRLSFPWRGRTWEFATPPESWFLGFLPDGNALTASADGQMLER